MTKKEIQKKRMMSYFIEAADKIIDIEGIDGLTIRKVADLAGYNSATLYNYFDNLNHLLFFSSIKFLKSYILDIPNYIKDINDPLDKYLSIWECFCKHSFNHPKIFYTMLFDKYSKIFNDEIKAYYSIFTDELEEIPENLREMLLNKDINEWHIHLLKVWALNDVTDSDMAELNELILLLYQGMLLRLLNQNGDLNIEDAISRLIKHIRTIIVANK